MFDRAGRMAGQMPMTSYANNNALAGVAGNFGGGGWSGLGKQQFPDGRQVMPMNPMNPATPPGNPAPYAPPVDPAQTQSALGSFGPAPPMPFNAQGLPQQFTDFRQQLDDWRGMRPDRPDFRAMRGTEGFDPRAARQDWRGQVQDWRGQRPQFANWR